MTNSSNQVVTFGCRLNVYESQVIKNLAHEAGLKDAIIVNTCGVTLEAERQARQAIRKLKRQHPEAKVIVTGCSAQVNPNQYALMPEVFRVIGNHEKVKLQTYFDLNNDQREKVVVNDIMSVHETAAHMIAGFESKARAYVQIQNGCDHRCTFCNIPFGRGNSRSVPMSEIIQQIKILVDAGYMEVVLTGVDITSYGQDFLEKPTLGNMVEKLFHTVPSLKRLRISSIDAIEVDDTLWGLIEKEERLLPHMHLSLQAGDDLILKRMKRRHLSMHAIDFCNKARRLRPDIAFGADLIAGFPTEKEEHFENTLKIVDACELTFLHVFPYSPRPGTPAARMPQVHHRMIKERAARLREKGEQVLHKFFRRCVGKKTHMLIEERKEGFFKGKTDQFAPVWIPAVPGFNIGQVVPIQIQAFTEKNLMAMHDE